MSRIVQVPIDSYMDSSLRKLEEELSRTGEEIISTATAGNIVLVTVSKRAAPEVIREVPDKSGRLLLG